MKKLICVLTLACIMSNIFAQVQNNPKTDFFTNDIELGKHYKKKGQNQQIAGWVLLGGGLSLMVISGRVAWENEEAAYGLALIGSISTVASIPAFIAGAKNKGRAEILLRSSSIPISIDPGKNIPVKSIGIGIKIGK